MWIIRNMSVVFDFSCNFNSTLLCIKRHRNCQTGSDPSSVLQSVSDTSEEVVQTPLGELVLCSFYIASNMA